MTAQYVWVPFYVNQIVLRDSSPTSVGELGVTGSGLSLRVYFQQDANWNVTAVTDVSGSVLMRLQYSAYGVATVLNADWSSGTAPFGSTDAYGVVYGFQGGRFDPASGKINFQRRDYDAATCVWQEQDLAGYVDGVDLYETCEDAPAARIDPQGMDSAPFFDDYDKKYLINGHGVLTPLSGLQAWLDTKEKGYTIIQTSLVVHGTKGTPYDSRKEGYLNAFYDVTGQNVPAHAQVVIKSTDLKLAGTNPNGTFNFRHFKDVSGKADFTACNKDTGDKKTYKDIAFEMQDMAHTIMDTGQMDDAITAMMAAAQKKAQDAYGPDVNVVLRKMLATHQTQPAD